MVIFGGSHRLLEKRVKILLKSIKRLRVAVKAIHKANSKHRQHLKYKSYLRVLFQYSIMHFIFLLLALLFTSPRVTATKSSSCAPFSSSLIEYSFGFQEPSPPLVNDEYTANFIQHKWYNIDVHIRFFPVHSLIDILGTKICLTLRRDISATHHRLISSLLMKPPIAAWPRQCSIMPTLLRMVW